MQMRELPKPDRERWARRPLVLAAPKGDRAAQARSSASLAQPRADAAAAVAGMPITSP
jgi:hypothetical protein